MLTLCPHCHEPIRKAKRKRIAQALPGPSRKAAKEAKRAKHREETAAIREAVFKRAEGRCEHIHGGGWRCPDRAVHLHHKEGGSGRRRQRQSVENTEALCWFHHKEAHGELRPRPPEGKQDAKEAT